MLSEFNTLDLLILTGLAVGMVRGFWTGVIRQVAGLVGLVLAFLVALRLMAPVGAMVVESLGLSEELAPVLGFIVVFLVVQIVVFALARTIEKLIGVLKLGIINRLAGGLFGAFKAALLVSVIFLVLATFDTPSEETRQGSMLYKPVAGVLPRAWDAAAEQWPRIERLADKFQEPLPFEGSGE